ncbi:peptidase M10A [Actinokineospora auranticolor]|uniref:peptidase M10A n=1 Tax=Actinokineospora auranticolor TaxID=155976 RepID=UPI0035A9ADF3
MRRSITTLAATALAAVAVIVAGQPTTGTTTTAQAADSEQLTLVAEAFTFDEGDAVTATATTTAATTACSDTTYALKSWKVATLNWVYNPAGAPANIASTALASITASTDTVAKGANRCGLAPITASTYTYGGTTTVAPQVTPQATCTGNDGKSVTGWGTLPAKVLAYTCTYFNSRGVVVSSDTLIANTGYTWFTTLPANCTGAQYDLQTTLTHERLHTAGLGHVDQTANATQTMTPASGPCDTTRRLLGAGDYAGLKTLTTTTN